MIAFGILSAFAIYYMRRLDQSIASIAQSLHEGMFLYRAELDFIKHELELQKADEQVISGKLPGDFALA